MYIVLNLSSSIYGNGIKYYLIYKKNGITTFNFIHLIAIKYIFFNSQALHGWMNNKLLVSDSNLKLTDNDIINGNMMVSNSTSFLPLHIGFQVTILTIVFSTGFELNKTGVLNT